MLLHALRFAWLFGVAGPPDTLPASQVREIDVMFRAGVDSTTPGCAVGVFKDGQTVFTRGYGMADLSHRVPITPDTRFAIASMSKQFTAAAILMLARQGKLQLDDDVRRYVPELPAFWRTITVRHLMTHTSGLRDVSILLQMADWPGAVLVGDEAVTMRDFWAFLGRQRALNFDPGTQWLYNNTGYVLMGVIVERLSGQPLREFFRREIFEPLGMQATVLVDDHTMVRPGAAVGYAKRGTAWRLRPVMSDIVGSTGITSTIGDLAKWNANFSSQRVGSAELFAAMEEATRLADGRFAGYGFGLVRGKLGTRRTLAHSGGLPGFSSELLRLPDDKLSVAVLCNRRSPEAYGLAEEVAGIVLGGVATGTRPAAEGDAAARFDSSLVGTYVNGAMDQWVRVSMTPKGLAKSEAGGPEVPLVPAIEGGYTASDASWRFSRSGGNVEVVVDAGGLPPAATYRRVTTRKGSTQGLAGTYWSPELQHAVRVTVSDSGVALLLTESNGVLQLSEAYPNGYVFGPVTVHFDRTRLGMRASALTISLHGVRRLRYKRQ